ncbi:hypothetical protein K470DRAFT_193489, partial [Piedraia hortae CBS 480.64]
KEPSSALEHYERAVEKESVGQLGESIHHYRAAFRLDSSIQEAYREKYFPPNASPSEDKSPAPVTPVPRPHPSETLPKIHDLITSFSTSSILPPPDSTAGCPLSALPPELLHLIIQEIALTDIATLSPLSQTCKSLAYTIHTSDKTIWKRTLLSKKFGLGGMYSQFTIDLKGYPLQGQTLTENPAQPLDITTPPHLSLSPSMTYREAMHTLPRIRFEGVYISTVNYTRPGLHSTNTLTWGAPVHVVTYYRYLRFFRDGSVITLTTTAEPSEVVYTFDRNLGGKEVLRGRWMVGTPAPPPRSSSPPKQEILIETNGINERYTYHMRLSFGGRNATGARNTKLNWVEYKCYNLLTDDWADFRLRNHRPFYWARVGRFGVDL